MPEIQLYYATNREAIYVKGKLAGFSEKFSKSDPSDIRFGEIKLNFPNNIINKFSDEFKDGYQGNGQELSNKIKFHLEKNAIETILYEEELDKIEQPILGSITMFNDLKNHMENSNDVLIYVHGFNIDWNTAVADAISLQFMLNKSDKKVKVVLFSWPSEGTAFLYVPYKKDRRKAELSGEPFGRAILKLGDYLYSIRKNATLERLKVNSNLQPTTSDFYKNRTAEDVKNNYGLCGSNIHILCHSMGSYVVQNALSTITDFKTGKLDYIFENIFLCAPDLDNDVFEPNQPLSRLNEMCHTISVYYSSDDKALIISHATKNFTDRLGNSGPIRPDVNILTKKVHFIDVSNKVKEFTEHGYYLDGITNYDIRESINDKSQSQRNHREGDKVYTNMWKFI